jgi:CHAT domain-containing protein
VPQGAVLLEMVKYRPLDPRPGLAEEKRWAAERYGAYVIRPAGEAQYVDLGVAGPLDKLIGEFRAALANPERLGARDLGRKLDDALMRPVRARLGDARTLYVAPEGALNLVPLGALVDEKGAYLLERYTINYLASGRDLLHLGRNEPARGPAIIIADPAFDQTPSSAQPSEGAQRRSRDFRSTKYERLPGTAAEAQTLKRVLPDAAVLTGTAATETAAKRIAGPRILHIATHGFFLEDVPGESEDPMLRSGLVFAGVNALSSAEDDGVLTALEASNLDLRGTKLVVLSACETGLGEVKNGEGVFGLRRAFVVAGAETLLMSLWQVADEATKDLMTSYYSRLSRGEPRGEALRQAQLAMLKDAKTAHPFFWAAFISSGESQPLK